MNYKSLNSNRFFLIFSIFLFFAFPDFALAKYCEPRTDPSPKFTEIDSKIGTQPAKIRAFNTSEKGVIGCNAGRGDGISWRSLYQAIPNYQVCKIEGVYATGNFQEKNGGGSWVKLTPRTYIPDTIYNNYPRFTDYYLEFNVSGGRGGAGQIFFTKFEVSYVDSKLNAEQRGELGCNLFPRNMALVFNSGGEYYEASAFLENYYSAIPFL